MKKIIVDMFGADRGPEVVVRGAAKALTIQKEYDIVFAGSSLIAQIVLREEAAKFKTAVSGLMKRVSVIDTNSFVTNHENPKNMVKDRNDTSMILAMEALKADEEIKAMVTAGSTGCALVGSCFHLGLEKGLLQPALASALPRAGGGLVVLLDCGANMDPRPKELEQYARLGSELVRNSFGVLKPVVGLLNVGKEKGKGTEILKEAWEKIEAAADENGYTFAGNVEGGDILSGTLDVVACGGLIGNVIIKGFESAGLIAAKLAAACETGVQNNEPDLCFRQIEDPYNLSETEAFNAANPAQAPSASAGIRRFFDYNSQAGAIFLGTKKRMIKAHGAATEDTICSCILQAINLDRGRG